MNLPNALTLLRIFLIPLLIAVLFSTGLPNRELVAAGIFFVAAATDWFDGYFARTRRQVTTVGILLDPIADKLLIAAAFISLVQMDPIMVPAWMVVIIVGREFAVTGLRSIAISRGIAISASELGKAKMISQVVAFEVIVIGHRYHHVNFLGIPLNAHFLGTAALWTVVAFALLSAFSYFRKFWRQIGSLEPTALQAGRAESPPASPEVIAR